MKGTISAGATHEDMGARAAGVKEGEKGRGFKADGDSCSQRGWIINGCYWCGEDGCVNPGWAMAQCHSCGKWYVVSR
jgi:hypothetical protein